MVSTALCGIGLVAYAVFLVAGWISEAPARAPAAAMLVALSTGWGIALLLCARALARRQRWATAPTVTSALLLTSVGWVLVGGEGGQATFGWLVLVGSVVCLVSVLVSRARPT